jgi:hypothetical protein
MIVFNGVKQIGDIAATDFDEGTVTPHWEHMPLQHADDLVATA